MLRRTYDSQDCPVARALEVVGERWTLLIVRDALRGTSRFGEFRRRLGIAANILATRLDWLVTAGVLERCPYQARPERYVYRLTPQGRELSLVTLALTQWGERHLSPPDAPHKTVRHERCGGQVEARLVCVACGAGVPAAEVVVDEGGQRPNPAPPPPT